MTTAATTLDRPQLAPDELQQLRWFLGGVLTLLGLTTAIYIDANVWLLGATALASLMTTLWPTVPARVPRIVHVLAFPFIVAFFAGDLWLRAELLPAMVRLDMLLLLYRALVYRERRDDLQVIVLGLFLVVMAGVLTVSLAFAVQILAYTTGALVLLFVITLVDAAKANHAAASGAPKTAARPQTPPAWAQHANWPQLFARVLRVANWRVVALCGVLFVGVIAVTGLLFLIIPRFQLENGMFLDRFISKKARTGFTDSIKFGDVTDIQQDDSVALHVDVSDPTQIPPSPYWRMLVLNEYENGTFRMSPTLRAEQFPGRDQTGVMVEGNARGRTSRATWVFYLEPGVSRYLPLLGEFRRLRFGEAQNFHRARSFGVVALTKDPVTMTAYQVEGFDLSARVHDSPGNFYGGLPSSLGRQGGAPDEQAILHRLASEATGAATLSAPDFAARVGAWLRSRHTYSLSPVIPPGPGDPLVRWVNSDARGHCELFAGSFVLLARAAGFPARIVTGFRGGTWNGYSNSFTIRNSDAHAWAEIYDRTTDSWLRADPLETPAAAQTGDAAAAALAQRTDRSWAARLDSLRVFWYRRIVSFDQQAQVQTFKTAKEATQSVLRRARERLDHVIAVIRDWWKTPWNAGRFATIATVLVIAGALTWLWRRFRVWALQLPIWRRDGRRDDPIRREAGRWLVRVRAADRVAPEPQIVADLQRLRYGARPTWPDPASVFRRARIVAKTLKSR